MRGRLLIGDPDVLRAEVARHVGRDSSLAPPSPVRAHGTPQIDARALLPPRLDPRRRMLGSVPYGIGHVRILRTSWDTRHGDRG